MLREAGTAVSLCCLQAQLVMFPLAVALVLGTHCHLSQACLSHWIPALLLAHDRHLLYGVLRGTLSTKELPRPRAGTLPKSSGITRASRLVKGKAVNRRQHGAKGCGDRVNAALEEPHGVDAQLQEA